MKLNIFFLLLSYFLAIEGRAHETILEISASEAENADKHLQDIFSSIEPEKNPVYFKRPDFIQDNQVLKEVNWLSNDVQFINQKAEKDLDTLLVISKLNKQIASKLAGERPDKRASVSKRIATIEEREFIYSKVIHEVLFQKNNNDNLRKIDRYRSKTFVNYLSSFDKAKNDRTLRHQGVLELARRAARHALSGKKWEDQIGKDLDEVNNQLHIKSETVKTFTVDSLISLLNYHEGEKTLNFTDLVAKVVSTFGQHLKWEKVDNGVEVNRTIVKLVYTDGQSVISKKIENDKGESKFLQTPINPYVRHTFISRRLGDGDCALHSMGLTDTFYKNTHSKTKVQNLYSENYRDDLRAYPTRVRAIDDVLEALDEGDDEAKSILGSEVFKRHLGLKEGGLKPLGELTLKQISNAFLELKVSTTDKWNIVELPMVETPEDSEVPRFPAYYSEKKVTKAYLAEHYLKFDEYLAMSGVEGSYSLADIVAKKNKVLFEFWRDPYRDYQENGYQFFRRGGDLSGEHKKKVYLKHSGIHFNAFVPIKSYEYSRTGSVNVSSEDYVDPADGSKYEVKEVGYDLNALIESRVHELLFKSLSVPRKDNHLVEKWFKAKNITHEKLELSNIQPGPEAGVDLKTPGEVKMTDLPKSA